MSSKFVRITRGLADFGKLILPKDVNKHIDSETDYYLSTYNYTKIHLDHFQKTGSVKGLKDLYTNKLWFDFDDDSNDLANAQKDAQIVVKRLLDEGFPEDSIDVYFSGNRGFTVEVLVDKDLNKTQVEYLTLEKYGKDLKTLDNTMYDYSQIFRIPNTKHPKSGLYKTQLSIPQLNKLKIETIKEMAKKVSTIKEKTPTDIPEELLIVPEAKKLASKSIEGFSLSKGPTHWKDYKWALLNAYKLEASERHSALMVIAATARGLGYDESLTRAMCLSFDEKFQAVTGKPPVEDLESNVIPSVFKDDWNGGQYSYKNNKWLQKYCERIGTDVNIASDELTVEIDDVFTLFKDYAKNIDELTIRTGIPALDKKLRMTIGMAVGIVAAPGVGKTSLAIQILNSMSKENQQSIFFSYDMYHSLVFQKLVQKHSFAIFGKQINSDEIFDRFKAGDIKLESRILEVIEKEYKNVEFCFKAGQSPSDIIQTIKHVKEKTGNAVRLIVIDYNELVLSDMSDSTQSSAFVVQKLREIANTYNCCVVVLLQPNKMAGTPADELTSYRSAKGSSAIEQALSIMLGMSRPGYDPRHPEEDKFMVINCLKNRMGSLFNCELSWDGLTGCVREMTSEDKALLCSIEERKKLEKEDKSDSSEWG